jgi:hypothetical protein
MSTKISNTYGRVVCRVDLEQKNYHTFSSGETIRLERDFNNFDRKYTQQVLGEVVSADYIPEGSLLLFNHNSLHPVNEIFNHGILSGEDIASGVKIFSIPEAECYLWKAPGSSTWNPTKGFATGERVFRPYEGIIQNIEPKKIEDVLYVTSG